METPSKEQGESSFQPLERSISLPGKTSHSSSVSNEHGEEPEQLVLDQVSQLTLMREQDADLLESMHYAASQVSQYSPGGTPILRPKDRSLPMEDVPLMLMPAASERREDFLVQKEDGENHESFSSLRNTEIRTTYLSAPLKTLDQETNTASNVTGLSLLAVPAKHLRSRSLHDRSIGPVLGILDEEMSSATSTHADRKASVSSRGQSHSQMLGEGVEGKDQTSDPQARYRRLLSGEVRNLEGELESKQNVPPTEEEETTASPVSVAEETETSALQQKQKKESGLAEQRRVREAMQFAEAVGEKISMREDELCIIEDSTDSGESDDDDDGCESKEIVMAEMESIHDAMSASQAQSLAGYKEEQVVVTEEPPTVLPSHVDVPPHQTYVRRKTKRPNWPFGPAGSDYDKFLDNLSDGLDQNDFVYKGICANPPEITKRGIQRGNYAQLHRKAWLEVSDKYHRYGKNLRSYYRLWERLGFPTNQFFDWLDSKGEAAGQPLPNVEDCPRSVLDSDTVLYITNPEVTEGYALDIVCGEDGRGRIFDVDGRPVETGADGWIFVLRDNVMYGAEKITSITGHSKQRFHHSSFFGGKAVAAAGIIITDEEGYLTRLYPHSGHYRPGEAHMQRMLFFLHRKGVDLRTFYMDTQQFRHVSRDKDTGKKKEKVKDGEKKKKIDSLHMEKAINVACFLAHKASFIGSGIFDKVHNIRTADATSVSEALQLVDQGGHWHQKRFNDSNMASLNINDSLGE